MNNSDVERLRKEVRKRRGDVTSKIARIRRNTGVEIAGTREDPRRAPNVVKKYNSQQLRKYLNDLDAFQSRGNGYVGGAKSVPISKAAWSEYKRVESAYNKIGAEFEKKISGIKIPGTGMNIREYQSTIHPRAEGESVNKPYGHLDRKPSGVKDEKALKTLTANLKRKLNPGHLSAEIKKSRTVLNKMLVTLGNHDLIGKANKLTDNQFNIMWNYTNFASIAGNIYALQKAINAGEGDRWYSSVVEDNSDDIRELFDAAEKFPATEDDLNAPDNTQGKTNKRR